MSVTKKRSGMAQDYVSKAQKYMDTCYQSATIQDVARQLGLTRIYLSTLFKSTTGLSPREYLLNRRMSKGRELLYSTNLPVFEIACAVGYKNATPFSKNFAKYYGLTPTIYRQKYRAAEEEELR